MMSLWAFLQINFYINLLALVGIVWDICLQGQQFNPWNLINVQHGSGIAWRSLVWLNRRMVVSAYLREISWQLEFAAREGARNISGLCLESTR